ncbi:MAG TPA: serine protease [Anaeromyxobacteraceae bacterium]|nr:serine protease [Anaeromyxobacteraceae bacterium]
MIANRLLPFIAGVALAAGALAGFLPRHGVAQSGGNPRSATVQKVYSSAVRIQISAGGKVVRSASGVSFARDGDRTYVLTNAHVVEPSKSWKQPIEMRVLTGGNATIAARVVAAGQLPDMDVAVVEVQDSTMPITPLSVDDTLELGDDLVVIGAPFGKGLSVAAGIVSQVEYDVAESVRPRAPRALKTDAAIGYGSSGGGVFDVPGGRLVGLIEGYRTARVEFGKAEEGYHFDVPMPGETFVAPAAKIRRFLAERGLSRLAGSSATASVPDTSNAKM